MLIVNWVSNFDSTSVNDSFDNRQNRIPSKLNDMKPSISLDYKQIDRMALSPNNLSINEYLRGQSNSMIGHEKIFRLGRNAGFST